jgi:hypothetical protein
MAILKLSTGTSNFEIEIGTEVITQGANINLHVGGDNYSEQKAIYEADKGFIILQAMPQVVSQWGDSNFTTALTARDSNFEKTEKIFSSLEELFSRAYEDGQEKNSLTINWVRKQILDYYFKQTSSNARFEVTAMGRSTVVRGPSVWPFGAGAVIDTKTANIEMSFTFRVQKLISPEEFNLLELFINAAIDQKELISFQYK